MWRPEESSNATEFDWSHSTLAGHGPPVLCLHGLAGYAGEWAGTAGGLSGSARVVAFDARGHGDSARLPADVSRVAHVADAVFVIEALQLGSAVVVGQSLGGQTALLLAAQRPDLVCGLVVAEAGPDSGGGDAYINVEKSLRSWPVPFPTRDAAVEYFQGRGFAAEVWADGLERRKGGLWPRFDIDVLIRTVREADRRTYWDEWEGIDCPMLVVCGEHGTVPPEHARELVERAKHAKLAVVADAGHDVHLERTNEWRGLLKNFLISLH